MREGEDMLSFFHASCSQALAALAKADKTRFLGNLDRDISLPSWVVTVAGLETRRP